MGNHDNLEWDEMYGLIAARENAAKQVDTPHAELWEMCYKLAASVKRLSERLARIERRFPSGPKCPNCGYSLALPYVECPQCGRKLDNP